MCLSRVEVYYANRSIYWSIFLKYILLELFSTFQSLRVLVCALGGRIDLSPGSSREIGASAEKEDFDRMMLMLLMMMMLMLLMMMMLMLSNLMMMMLMLSNLMIMMRDAEALKLGDQHNADALKLDDDDAVGLKPGDAYNAALEFCDDQHNAALELDDYDS